ncbi:hypothetical protein WMY93_004180 [Mugilogobius chulae]|uniref:IGFBP N-terminal domain-containing protein n=1 Tax=Mugilogobius chulae TaxID=88201 RepID=A0AAW0PQD2_9GOBI
MLLFLMLQWIITSVVVLGSAAALSIRPLRPPTKIDSLRILSVHWHCSEVCVHGRIGLSTCKCRASPASHQIRIQCTAGAEAECPAECSCPSPPACARGVSLVLDHCGCCKVCAKQFNQDCSSTEPCDHIKGLRCHLGAEGTLSEACAEVNTILTLLVTLLL